MSLQTFSSNMVENQCFIYPSYYLTILSWKKIDVLTLRFSALPRILAARLLTLHGTIAMGEGCGVPRFTQLTIGSSYKRNLSGIQPSRA